MGRAKIKNQKYMDIITMWLYPHPSKHKHKNEQLVVTQHDNSILLYSCCGL